MSCRRKDRVCTVQAGAGGVYLKLELVIYVVTVLTVLLMLESMPVASLSRQVVTSCSDLIQASSIHSAEISLPCELENNTIVYGEANRLVFGTSYGMVVRGEHWNVP